VIIHFLYALTTLFLGTGCWFSIRYYKTLDTQTDQKAFGWFLAGFGVQTAALISQWIDLGSVPFDRIDGILTALALSLAVTLALSRVKAPISILTSLFLPLIFFLSFIGFIANLKSEPFMDPKLMTPGMASHIFLTFLGFSNFTIGFGVGMVFWIQEGQLKQHQIKGWSYRLPSLEILEGLTVFHLGLGFVFWTAGLVLGTEQAYQVWNGFPLWDPKILGSILVLVIYALFFLLRWVFGMRGKKTMTLVMVGYFLALFTFLGVRLFLTTQHTL
jgi:HemX protein